MPSYEDDWDLTDFTGDESDEEYVDDDNESHYSDYEDTNAVSDDRNEPFKAIKQPVWKNVVIGGNQYMVSDMGCVRKPDTLFEVHYGLEQCGTPFRTMTFPSADGGPSITYYMHDLVWQTFNGNPPPGWEVRHTFNETRKNKRYYGNALRHLTIMPIIVSLRPHIFT